MSKRQRNKILVVRPIRHGFGFLILTTNGSVGFSLPPKPNLTNLFQFQGKLQHHLPHLYDEIISMIKEADAEGGIALEVFQKYLIGKYAYGRKSVVLFKGRTLFELR